jgi:general stress protein 26
METIEKKLVDQEAIQKIKDLVNDVNICMFTTLDETHNMMSRPMFTASVDDEGNIWFFTNEFSEKIQEVSKDNIVNLIYAHPAKNIYVNVKGTCSLIIDRSRMEELWNSSMKNWFPEGLDDPKICLVKVSTETAYYWNHSSSKMGLLFNMIASITKGDQYKETEKGKLNLAPTPQGE